MPITDNNVARFLPASAHQHPDSPAVVVPSCTTKGQAETRSYAQLDRESSAAAKLLRDAGVVAGCRVLVMVRPGTDLIRTAFALFRLGAVPVLIDPGMGLRSFLACVQRTQPEALVGIPLAHWIARFFSSRFKGCGIRVVVGNRAWQTAVSQPTPDTDCHPAAADEPAAILFTSGSTGAPKGVLYTHGIFDAQVTMIRQAYGIQPGEVDMPMLPIFALFNPALGMTTVVPPMNPSRPAQADPGKLVQVMNQYRITNSFGSPVLWHRIARHCQQHAIELPSLKRVLIAGAAVSSDLVHSLTPVMPNGIIHTPYGATECLPLSSLSGKQILDLQHRSDAHQEDHAPAPERRDPDTHPKGGTGAWRGTCVGKPLPSMQARIIPISDDPIDSFSDTSILADVSDSSGIGEMGELVVTGPVVTRSYDKLPEATTRAKIKDSDGIIWHRMGDIAYFDAEGAIWFCGRMAERVQTVSQTLFTDCCESIANRHPKVFRTALVGVGPAGNQEPVLAVEMLPEHQPSRSTRNALADSILKPLHTYAEYQAIRRCVFFKRFPVDVRHNAKIHRLTLARRVSSR